MMDAYVQSLALERRYGRTASGYTERAGSRSEYLGRVIQDYRKRFSAFSPTAAMAYKKKLTGYYNTAAGMAAVWNTFVPIKKAKEGNAS